VAKNLSKKSLQKKTSSSVVKGRRSFCASLFVVAAQKKLLKALLV
jgi:hypothetical protein